MNDSGQKVQSSEKNEVTMKKEFTTTNILQGSFKIDESIGKDVKINVRGFSGANMTSIVVKNSSGRIILSQTSSKLSPVTMKISNNELKVRNSLIDKIYYLFSS